MTGRFETLIYTDCRPGQGLGGHAGLQFQAQSADSAARAQPIVQQFLLYEPPSAWMAARRPVESYPPSFGHVAGNGLYATAAGVYLGREANGNRQGNQLTHSIVTDDPANYGRTRPAQLFGAKLWMSTPAETTTSTPVERHALTTEISPALARDFVLDQPAGREVLLALVSALEVAGAPGSPRVLFVGERVDEIVLWLVAGTLLVPRHRALELGFKIFSADPARSGVPITAVHPEFAGPSAQLDNQLGYAVFDLHSHANTPVPTSTAAARWVGLFLDEDPASVVDALDVAAASGIPDEEAAAALGIAAILQLKPDPQYAETIVEWLRTGPEYLRDAYGTDVAAMFAETPQTWSHRLLTLLDGVGTDGLIPGRAASVRLALIRKELAAALGPDSAVARGRLPALPAGEWLDEDASKATHAVVTTVNSGISPIAVEAVLRVASRFDIDVDIDHIAGPARDFVEFWADRPNHGYEPADWPRGQRLEHLLLICLRERAAADEQGARDVGELWWRRLLPGVQGSCDSLTRAVLGAAVRHNLDDRITFVEHHLAAAVTDAQRFEWTVEALWSQVPPSDVELQLLLRLTPERAVLPQRIFSAFVDRLLREPRLQAVDLRLCRELVDSKLLVPRSGVAGVLADDTHLLQTLGALAGASGDDDEATRVQLGRLAAAPSRIVRARAPEVIRSLLRAGAYNELYAVLRRHDFLARPYCLELARALREGDEVRHAAVACYLAYRRDSEPNPLPQLLVPALRQWIVRASNKRVKEAGKRMAALDERWGEIWQRVSGQLGRRRNFYRLVHPFRR